MFGQDIRICIGRIRSEANGLPNLSSMAILEVCIQINKKDENIYAWRDKGRTGIHGGERVDKDDIRIEANGTLDEVNAEIGIIRALLRLNNVKTAGENTNGDDGGHVTCGDSIGYS